LGSPRYRKTEQPNLVSAASFVARGTSRQLQQI
jgi:hypothetical protein